MSLRCQPLGFALVLLVVAAGTVFAEPRREMPATLANPEPIGVAVETLTSTSIDVSGEWQMFLPAGWEQTVTIERLGENRYYVRPPYVMKGTYVVEEGRLTRLSEERLEGEAKPESKLPAREAFAWEIRSPYMLTLVPDERSRSNDYLGATLFRPRETGTDEAKAPIDEAKSKHAEPASGNPDRPFAIDIPETELDVRIFPGQRGSRLPRGELRFPITIRNDSKAPIEFELPRTRGALSSVMARVRLLEPASSGGSETPQIVMSVYRADGDLKNPKVTVLPGEEVRFEAQLGWSETEPDWRLQRLQRKYEICLSMEFLADGRRQVVTGPRGSVVEFPMLELVR